MTGNRTLLALGLAAGLAVAAAVAAYATGREGATVEAEGPVLPALAAVVADRPTAPSGDLASIAIHAGVTRHAVVRAPQGVWRVPQLADYPADPAIVDGVVAGLAGLTREAALTRRPDRFRLLGLAPPDAAEGAATRITATARDEDGAIADILVGDPRPGGVGRLPGHYVRVPRNGALPADGLVPPDQRAWLATGPLHLPVRPIDWVDRRVLDIDPNRLARITIAVAGQDATLAILPADGPSAEAARAAGHAVDDFMLVDPPVDRVVTRGFRIDNVAETLHHLRLTDVRPADDLADRPMRARAVAETVDGLTVTLETRHDARAMPWLLIHAQAAPQAEPAIAAEAHAITARTAGWAYRVPVPDADRLSATVQQVTEAR